MHRMPRWLPAQIFHCTSTTFTHFHKTHVRGRVEDQSAGIRLRRGSTNGLNSVSLVMNWATILGSIIPGQWIVVERALEAIASRTNTVTFSISWARPTLPISIFSKKNDWAGSIQALTLRSQLYTQAELTGWSLLNSVTSTPRV